MASHQIIGLSVSRTPQAARRARLPRWERWLLVCLVVTSGVLVMLTLAGVARAHADDVAFLIDATVRPGHGLADSDGTLAYTQPLCDKVSYERSYGDGIGEVESEVYNGGRLQPSRPIDQAVNEPRAAQGWKLLNSAAHYTAPAR